MVVNCECRSILCPTVVVSYSCWSLLEVPICQKAQQPFNWSCCKRNKHDICRKWNSRNFTMCQQSSIHLCRVPTTGKPIRLQHHNVIPSLSTWPWISRTSSPNGEEVHPWVWRDQGRHRSSPVGTTNNTPESQYSIASWTPQWSNF